MNEQSAIHPRTAATVEQLRDAEWFRNVGARDTAVAKILSSWDEAVKSCSSDDWEHLGLAAAASYRDRLAEHSPTRLNEWNEVVARVKPISMQLVNEKTASVMADRVLPKVFLDTIHWDILHVLMEAEYADVYPPGFYASQAYWYVQGHFPCGWEGNFPKGRLVIF